MHLTASQTGGNRWIRDNELLFVMWKDIRQVCMLSTIHTVYKGERAERRTWTLGGESFMQPIPMPTPVKAYNQHMGGVDLSDALIKYYNVSHKTKKWYKTLFFHFVDIAVVNAFLLHKDLAEKQNTSPVSQKVFREELCLQLVGAEQGGVLRPCSEPGLPEDLEHYSLRVKTKLSKDKEEKTPSEKLCFPVCITEGQVVDTRDKATKGRKTCVLCLKEKNRLKTIWKCVACDVPLCVVPDRNCFRDWHLLMTKEANKDGITEDGPQSSKKINA
ncbi:hypothetical protein GJAV_G00165330 [Gymnothorax javanicus]|nr:hypothetical protein GJAV_G00165330 [Gymnothorax javanicus]